MMCFFSSFFCGFNEIIKIEFAQLNSCHDRICLNDAQYFKIVLELIFFILAGWGLRNTRMFSRRFSEESLKCF